MEKNHSQKSEDLSSHISLSCCEFFSWVVHLISLRCCCWRGEEKTLSSGKICFPHNVFFSLIHYFFLCETYKTVIFFFLHFISLARSFLLCFLSSVFLLFCDSSICYLLSHLISCADITSTVVDSVLKVWKKCSRCLNLCISFECLLSPQIKTFSRRHEVRRKETVSSSLLAKRYRV